MSYFIDDDATQVRQLKDQIDALQSLVLASQFSVSQENVESGQSTFPIANPSARGGGGSGGGGGGGLSEPLLFTITTITPQTPPTKTNINAALTNVFKITLDRDIEFDIINPHGAKFEMLHIVIKQDPTTARTVTWPGSVNGTPVIDTALGSETTVSLFNMADGLWRFVTTKGGVTSGGEFFGPWTGDHDAGLKDLLNVKNIDFNGPSSTIEGLHNLQFAQTAHSINSLSGQLVYQGAALDKHSFVLGAVEAAKIQEVVAGVYRLNMLGHSIDVVKDIRLDVSATAALPGTIPGLAYDSATTRILMNYPTGSAGIFVTENNVIGSTQIKTNSIDSNIINANDVLQLGVDVTVPTVPGEFRSDGTDVFVFSGGSVKNLSNILATSGMDNPATADLDMNSFNIINVNRLDSNAASIPIIGKIRLGNNELITWLDTTGIQTASFGMGNNDDINILGTNLNLNTNSILNIGGDTILLLPTIPTIDSTNDFLMVRDATDGSIKKVAVGDIGGGEVFVWTANHDANGNLLILDPDGDSSISSASDDSIQIQTGGSIRLAIDNVGVTVSNSLFVNGNTTLGNAGTDNINMNGIVTTDIDMALGSTIDYNSNKSSATAGIASALPANPQTYIEVKVNGTKLYVPAYNA